MTVKAINACKMKKYDIFDAANWLLDETYSIYEDAKKEAEEAEETEEVEDTAEDTAEQTFTEEQE